MHDFHAFKHDVGRGACEGVGKVGLVHGFSAHDDGFLVGQKSVGHFLACTSVCLGLGIGEDVEAEVSVEVPTVAPVHVEETFVVQTVEHEGMASGTHDGPGIVHGASGHELACEAEPVGIGVVFPFLQIVHVGKPEGLAERTDEVLRVGSAGRESPLHVAGLSEPEAEAGHGIGL